jgi:hypothetical protein
MAIKDKKHSTPSEIESVVRVLSKKINAEDQVNFNFYDDICKYDDMLTLQIKENGYHLVGQERGVEVRRWITEDLDELLFWIFKDIAFTKAHNYELVHRVGEYDRRIIVFPKEVELLSIINPKWGERAYKMQLKYLEFSPYDCDAQKRNELESEYTKQGMSLQEAREKARIKYPLPYRKKMNEEDIQTIRSLHELK